jgi:hypothetical protein
MEVCGEYVSKSSRSEKGGTYSVVKLCLRRCAILSATRARHAQTDELVLLDWRACVAGKEEPDLGRNSGRVGKPQAQASAVTMI